MRRSTQIRAGGQVIYFIASDECSRVKVGRTSNLSQRLESLRTGSPVRLYILGFFEVPTVEHAIRIENALHREFIPYHSHGEWFKLNRKTHGLIELRVEQGIGILPEGELLAEVFAL